MLIFSIFCRQDKIIQAVNAVLNKEFGEDLEFVHLTEPEAIQFHLRYEMPDFAFFDLDDPQINATATIHALHEDPWLVNMGVFGLSEQENIPAMPGVFSIMTPFQISSLLPHLIHILKRNEQLLVQQAGMMLELGNSGRLCIENKPQLLEAYAELLTTALYNENYIDMQGKYGLKFSLVEMLINAVEHGNCGINYEEKQAWLESGRDMSSLIAKKCEDASIAAKWVDLVYSIRDEESIFTIRDQGKGFDVSTLPDPTDPLAILDLHGRGIFMTRNYVRELRYNETGNEVTLVIEHQKNKERKIPEGLLNSPILTFEPGQVVFKEHDKSDTLYYIVSGDFEIIVKDQILTTLNNTHIFLGEMAFLLGNRRTATVRAKTHGRLVAIRSREWLEAVEKFPYYGVFLARLLAKKLDQQSKANMV